MSNHTESEFIIPAIIAMGKRDGRISTTELISVLRVFYTPDGEDIAIIKNRSDDYFSQKVRNLKAHNTLGKLGYAISTENGWELTEAGEQLFEKLSDLIGDNPDFHSDVIDYTNLPLQQIFYGAPGTGKSHEVMKLTGEWISEGEEKDLPNVFRTTFHPDTDYASFVGCYKPTMKPTSKEEKTLTGKDEEIVYEFVPQVFTDAYVYAYNNSDQPTYLVIEEINRGNCAQIFGDLFQLLDRKGGVSEYKIKADKDLTNYLIGILGEDSEGIKDGKLCLPANLNILATMNTSDQSLFPMDSAFKRRWEWEYVPINYGTDVKSGTFEITIGEKAYPWVEFIKHVNEKIFDLTQSEDKQLGNFFIKHSVDEKEFKSKVMFYLWYEVLRDETENNKYFFYKKTISEGKEVSSKFTFKDLFGDKATETLQQFMEYLGVQ